MWELIRANQRKSLVLIIVMALLLILLGYVIGFAVSGPYGGFNGIIIATAIWFIMTIASYYRGSSILLSTAKAIEATPDDYPQLYNVVEEMKIAAGLPVMPKVYVIRTPAINAFATGRNPANSAIAVTTGLLEVTNRDELQGVVAHEMSHIINRDIRFMTIAGIMLGSIVLISQVFLRSMFYAAAGSRGGGSSKGGGAGRIIMMLVAVVLAILAPIAAQLLYFAASRKREYLADASAVRLTRYPEGLASALEKIANSTADMESANSVTAPMFIANPLKPKGKKLRNLSSTHPPLDERIRILRALSGASYNEYQETYQQVTKKKSGLMPGSALADTDAIGIRGK